MNWLEEIHHYRNDLISDIKSLIAIPSIREEASEQAPFGKPCREALDHMLALGEKEGFATENIDGYAGVISYGEGEDSVGVLAHLDVVPVGEGWSKDPFQAVEEHGYLFGRGVLDDKGPAVAAFYAMKMLKDKGIQLNKKIMLILGCDEESGMECMNYYVKHAQIPTVGFTPDAEFPVIYGEKGGVQVELSGKVDSVIESMHAGERMNIVIGKASCVVKEWDDRAMDLFAFYLNANGLKGSVTYVGDKAELMIEGGFAHAAMPYLGNNAALHLLNFVGNCFDDKFAADTYAMLKDWQGKPLGIFMESPTMGFLTMSTGIVNIEQGHACIMIDIRYPQETNADIIMEGFHKTAAELEYGLSIELKKDTKPLYVDPNSELVTTLSDMYRFYSKDELTPNMTIGGGTYAKKFPNFVAFGPEFPNQKHPEGVFVGGCHQKDEGICIDDLLCATAIYAGALETLAK